MKSDYIILLIPQNKNQLKGLSHLKQQVKFLVML
jgi:hypothetical protein